MKTKIGNKYVKPPVTSLKKAKKKVAKKRVVSSKASKNTLLQGLVEEDNLTFTENGAVTYKSTLNDVLDLFAMGGALRERSDTEVIQIFTKAFAQDRLLTLKCVFNIRNVRGGAGERKVFRTILRYLGDNHKELVAKNIENIPHFGRYDDLLCLFGTESEAVALELIRTQLDKDVESYEKDEDISLLAKWLPSENTSSQATRKNGNLVRSHLGWTTVQYRKTLTALRKHSKVLEVKLSAREWEDVDYGGIPSNAGLKYRKAFVRHDGERYGKFLEDVASGNATINASALFPYDIADKVLMHYDKSKALDALWNGLPDYLEDNDKNMLVVADVSGSMHGRPMAVSTSLALYTAERNRGAFNGHFMTFSSDPKLVRVVGSSIYEKITNISKASWGLSTNLQATFDLILKTAVKHNTKPSDMPNQVLIVSDMEFNRNSSYHNSGETNRDAIVSKFKAAGYKAPQLVWWNVNSRNNNVPAKADDKGNLLVSGCSPSVFKTLLSGNQYTPWDQCLETLNQEAYDRVVV